jgi:hypothetical protein
MLFGFPSKTAFGVAGILNRQQHDPRRKRQRERVALNGNRMVWTWKGETET